MNAKEIINLMGGRKEVIKITGLSRSRICQMINRNDIPWFWLMVFSSKNPKVKKLISSSKGTHKRFKNGSEKREMH